MKFKVGDVVEVVWDDKGNATHIRKTGKITNIDYSGYAYPYHLDCFYYNFREDELKLKKEKIMNIKEQFTLAITPEPQKSFRKVGITDGDNLLTDDGVKVFLSWLLTKNADAFKKEVVDDMVAEMEK